MHHLNRIRKNQTTSLQSHYHLMPSLYLTKELTSSPPLPLPASLLSKKLSLPKSTQHTVDSSARRTTVTRIKSSNTTKSLHCFHHYNKQLHPLPLLHREQSRPYVNLHLIDYVDNTHVLFHSLKNFYNLLNNILLFILIDLTSTHQPHLTLQTYRTTMTL